MTVLFLILYNIVIGVGILLLAPLLLILRPKHRRHVRERMGILPRRKGCVWVHAASVGEVKASAPLLRVIASSGRDVLLTTMTPAGRLYASTLNIVGVSVSYAPADCIAFTLYAMHRVRPSALIILETEIWPDLIVSASLYNVDIVSINARLSEKAFRGYLFMRPVMSYLLRKFKMLCVQSQEDAERFAQLGARREDIHIMGNLKYAAENTNRSSIAQEIKGLFRDRPIIIAGSTHEGEERIVVNCFLSLRKRLRTPLLILAPRHLNRLKEVEEVITHAGLALIKRSMIAPGILPDDYEIIVLDTVGELADLYSIGDAIFVGGSMVPVGGHNLIEVVIHKKPVLYGKYTETIKESVALLNGNGGIMVESEDQLCSIISDLIEHPEEVARLGEKAFAVIDHKAGTLATVTDILKKAGIV